LGLAFGASGFAALIYQTAWQRVLTQVIGSDSVSAVLTVVIFMIWLGVGSEIARRVLPRLEGRVGTFYAAIELVIGLSAIFSIPVLRMGNAWLATTGTDSVYVDFAFNLLLLAIPVVAMGMTTPLVVEVAKTSLERLGHTVGRYYGLNIFGAAIGAFVTGLIAIELLGLTGVTILAAAINIGVGLLILYLFGRGGSVVRSIGDRKFDFPARYIIAAVSFGFCTLALQIVFFRVLSNYFTMSTVVFPLVLGSYLLLMSLGQTVGGRLADRFPTKLPIVIPSLLVAGGLLLLFALRFPIGVAAALGALRFTTFNGQLLDGNVSLIGDPNPGVVLFFSMLFMLGVIAWAALFPVMLRLVTQDIREAGSQFAALYSFYTVGNVAGAFLAGMVLFQMAGTWGAAVAIIAIGAVGATAVLWGKNSESPAIKTIAVVSAAVVIAALPTNIYGSIRLDRYTVEEVLEGTVGVASVVPTDRFYTIVDMNRTASASALAQDPGPTDEYEAWRWNHSELFALDPDFRPTTVLIIGIGHGYLVDALLDLPFIKKITVVDLSQEIVDAVEKYTRTSTSRIFNDPRVDIVVADGRRFIQQAIARGDRYDLIQNKINEPWHAGSGNLFTVEFIRSEKQLLNEGGYLGLRPVLGHVADALEVFDEGVWPGFYHMYFKNGSMPQMAEAVVTPDIEDAWFRALPGKDGKTEREPALQVVRLTPDLSGDYEFHNTDDRPTFEYYSVRKFFGAELIERENLWYWPVEQVEVPVRVQSRMD
jgi:spermidine synthase